MFEAAELGRSLGKKEFHDIELALRARLLEVQRAARQAGLPVVVVIAGVPGAGKGEVVNRLLEWFDSRGVQVHADWDETEEETQRPHWWRFWRNLPAGGQIGLFFEGWYRRPLHDHVLEDTDEAELDAACARILETEDMLVKGGALVIKFWCHLPERVYHHRVKERKRDPKSHWRMAPETAIYAKHYEPFLHTARRVIRLTDTGESPWHLIEATDPHYRDATLGQLLLSSMEAGTGQAQRRPAQDRRATRLPPLPGSDPVGDRSVLDSVDLGLQLDKKDYATEREALQAQINKLTWKAFRRRRASVLVFEGWDAAGKGGTIRRLVRAMDARLYNVIPIAAPTEEERAHHYLWRFWRQIPRDGYCTVFDRSWYGRVLVERVEGLTPPAAWGRAYHEINDFEAQFVEHGGVLLKFWLHIDPDEQLRRFRSREVTPHKAYKITPEDWRNREHWDDYRAAVNEMVVRTSTEYAPWHLISANDKRNARIEVLRAYAEALERGLE